MATARLVVSVVTRGTALPLKSDSHLNDLVRRLALMAAPRTYSMTARLLDGKHGTRIELKATHNGPRGIEEYVRHVTLSVLERDGAAAVAQEVARDARAALAGEAASAGGVVRKIRR